MRAGSKVGTVRTNVSHFFLIFYLFLGLDFRVISEDSVTFSPGAPPPAAVMRDCFLYPSAADLQRTVHELRVSHSILYSTNHVANLHELGNNRFLSAANSGTRAFAP